MATPTSAGGVFQWLDVIERRGFAVVVASVLLYSTLVQSPAASQAIVTQLQRLEENAARTEERRATVDDRRTEAIERLALRVEALLTVSSREMRNTGNGK